MDDDERLDGEDDLNGDDGGRLPAYPRSMLKMKITDGERIIKAIEYKRLPAVKLAETPLGAKVSSEEHCGTSRRPAQTSMLWVNGADP